LATEAEPKLLWLPKKLLPPQQETLALRQAAVEKLLAERQAAAEARAKEALEARNKASAAASAQESADGPADAAASEAATNGDPPMDIAEPVEASALSGGGGDDANAELTSEYLIATDADE